MKKSSAPTARGRNAARDNASPPQPAANGAARGEPVQFVRRGPPRPWSSEDLAKTAVSLVERVRPGQNEEEMTFRLDVTMRAVDWLTLAEIMLRPGVPPDLAVGAVFAESADSAELSTASPAEAAKRLNGFNNFVPALKRQRKS
jgi:hypothetical protein